MGDDECRAVAEVLKSGWIGIGPKTKEFEDRFAAYIGTNYAVALNSATAALHLALKVMDVEGHEVITTPLTFVSTNHCILYNDATPVFCDIDAETLNLDLAQVEALITPRTRAIIVVHYGGYAADMTALLALAAKHGLKVIEDAAHACGGEHEGKKLGSIGDIGCFSFHAVKNLATGDGGMITTNDPQIYARLLKLRWLGISKDTWARAADPALVYAWYYGVDEVGFKYHMNDINAAIGIVQLAKLDQMNARRAALSQRYTRALSTMPNIETPVMKRYMSKPAYHNYVIKSDQRDALHEHLKRHDIATGVHYIPNNHYEMYKTCRGPTPTTERVWKKLLTLPLYPDLSDSEQDLIVNTIAEFAAMPQEALV